MKDKEIKREDNRTQCIHCEAYFYDKSIDGNREYCYKEKCLAIQEELSGENSIELQKDSDYE